MVTYWVNIGLQVGLLFCLLRVSRLRGVAWHSAWHLFQPTHWFLLLYGLHLLLTQLLLPFRDWRSLELVDLGEHIWVEAAIRTQGALLLFLGGVVFGYLVLKGGTYIGEVSGRSMRALGAVGRGVLWPMGAAGVLGYTYLLAQKQPGEARSTLLSGIGGQVAFGASLGLRFVLAYWIADLALRGRRRQALMLGGASLGVLLLLGGRGYALTVVEYALLFYALVSRKVWSPRVVVGGSVGLFVLVQLVGPLLQLVHGRSIVEASESLAGAVDVPGQVLERGFLDAFENVTVIVWMDRVPHAIEYLWSGVRERWMTEYFPSAYQQGVGFPASLPGELWLVAGTAGLVVGGVLLGMMLRGLQVWYWSIESERALWLYLVAIPFLSAVGGNYIDQASKGFAFALPAAVVYVMDLVKLSGPRLARWSGSGFERRLVDSEEG